MMVASLWKGSCVHLSGQSVLRGNMVLDSVGVVLVQNSRWWTNTELTLEFIRVVSNTGLGPNNELCIYINQAAIIENALVQHLISNILFAGNWGWTLLLSNYTCTVSRKLCIHGQGTYISTPKYISLRKNTCHRRDLGFEDQYISIQQFWHKPLSTIFFLHIGLIILFYVF